jgi:hypothetical protein
MTQLALSFCLTAALLITTTPAWAFTSGSSGAGGAFNPTASVALQLPPEGVFHFTEVNIPAGVTVTFIKNPANVNAPVVILASGDINVAGTINVSANANDRIGGPGGYDGGMGGSMFSAGGAGKGPGGGYPGWYIGGYFCQGGGGGYGGGDGSGCASGGAAYGSASLVPLIGGSGGGGSSGTYASPGYKGLGGGGALLLASSGKINVTGALYANGASHTAWSQGGAGSGGAIRLIASIIDGNGTIQATGGYSSGGYGGTGRIRLEAEILLRTAQSNPYFDFSKPREVFAAALPTLRFVSIAGVAAPAAPTGDMDVSLPADVGNPVAVELASRGVPPGSTIKLLSAPENGVQATATSTPLEGTVSDSTATAQINIADGKSTLIASVGFTVTAALGEELAPYAGGEKVARVELTAGLKGATTTKLITASGKEYLVPESVRVQ